jgi:hypothetical protein
MSFQKERTLKTGLGNSRTKLAQETRLRRPLTVYRVLRCDVRERDPLREYILRTCRLCATQEEWSVKEKSYQADSSMHLGGGTQYNLQSSIQLVRLLSSTAACASIILPWNLESHLYNNTKWNEY